MTTRSHISPNGIYRSASVETGPVVCRNIIARTLNEIVLRVTIDRNAAKLPCIAHLGLVKSRLPVPPTPRAMFETSSRWIYTLDALGGGLGRSIRLTGEIAR